MENEWRRALPEKGPPVKALFDTNILIDYRLPDAIIWATAREASALLVTRNTKDFPADVPGVRVPY